MIPEFDNKEDLFEFLHENKNSLIAQKKAELKKADGISALFYDTKSKTVKQNVAFEPNSDVIKAMVVINTTNFMDSHDDVHIKGLWNKSLKENKLIMHLQEHIMAFDKIIADGEDLKVYTKTFTWKELGFDFKGETQALVFESTIRKDRNEYMFKEYSKGRVKNHSVGMHYVKFELAVDDKKYEDEFKIWEKYIDTIANKELAIEKGYFWAVFEAKAIEGSAVPIGSNIVTPTLENNMKREPSSDTHNEPPEGTQKINYKYLINNISL
jgi:hypothetical protein